MIEPKPLVRQLKRMKDLGSERHHAMRLDKNERTFPFPDEVFRDMMARVTSEDLTMYPDQTPLYKKLAARHGLDVSQILLTAGSDAALKTIFECYVREGDRVVFLDPTYAMIDVYSDLYGAQKTKLGYGPDLSFDTRKLLDAVTDGVRAVFIANPNQPTGTILEEAVLGQLLERCEKAGALLVMDEAYIQFSGERSMIRLAGAHPNLAVVQTFSKACGLASVRLGFIAAHADLIQILYRTKPLADINLFAVKLGEYLMDQTEIVEQYAAEIRESKAFLKQSLSKLGVECLDSRANFVHLRMASGTDLAGIVREMEKKGFLLRAGGQGLPAVLTGCVRITVGVRSQMKEFLHAFESVLQSLPALR